MMQARYGIPLLQALSAGHDPGIFRAYSHEIYRFWRLYSYAKMSGAEPIRVSPRLNCVKAARISNYEACRSGYGLGGIRAYDLN